jgi:hypothetical protein
LQPQQNEIHHRLALEDASVGEYAQIEQWLGNQIHSRQKWVLLHQKLARKLAKNPKKERLQREPPRFEEEELYLVAISLFCDMNLGTTFSFIANRLDELSGLDALSVRGFRTIHLVQFGALEIK